MLYFYGPGIERICFSLSIFKRGDFGTENDELLNFSLSIYPKWLK